MRVTQGTFSFLTGFDRRADRRADQATRSNTAGRCRSSTPTIRTRATRYWEMWGLPLFDTKEEDSEIVLREVRAAREAFPEHYIKLIAYDPTYTRQTTALAFIVNRPTVEKRFILDRIAGPGPRQPLPARRRTSGRRRTAGRGAELERPAAAVRAGELRVRHEAARPAGVRHRRGGARGVRRRRGGGRAPGLATQADLQAALTQTNVLEVLDQLDRELIALVPVKTRIREIAALLLIDRLRAEVGLASERPVAAHVVHGQPGDGQDDRRAEDGRRCCYRLGYIEEPRVVSCTRDDLVGQYVGHTAPKTKEVLRRAYGGVLFIDEAYYLYKPENERDYGGEAIEILLQVMEAERDKLVVIFAGYKDRMDDFFHSNPGPQLARRPPHRLPGLRRRRADGDRAPDARPPELRLRRGRRGGVPRVPRAARHAAAVRARPQRPQLDRPRPAAPGEPALRRGRTTSSRARS